MCKIISVTNRKLCADFFGQIRKISDCGISVILREKDLSEAEYETLAAEVKKICPDVILHSYIEAARRLNIRKIHLPMHILRENSPESAA